MAISFLPKEGALTKALQRQAYYNTAPTQIQACLYKSSFRPTAENTMADFIANEVAFDGYGREVITSMDTISLLGTTAWLLFASLLATFVYGPATVPPVTDTAGGCFVLVRTATGPDVFEMGPVFPFDAPVAFSQVGDTATQLISEPETN